MGTHVEYPQIEVVHRPVAVERVEAHLVPVNKQFSRVELVIGDTVYEMSRPDAQLLGQILLRAGGGE